MRDRRSGKRGKMDISALLCPNVGFCSSLGHGGSRRSAGVTRQLLPDAADGAGESTETNLWERFRVDGRQWRDAKRS